ncbi:Transposase [Pseudomonas sp. 22 E 5]|nr:Transposase [Pseudomonas sp. 22 E 5]
MCGLSTCLVAPESSRTGEHAHDFLGAWKGKLVCDDFVGYKASFELGITEIGCMSHARRKFFELQVANKSQLAEQALHSIGGLYEIERQAKGMNDEDCRQLRQKIAEPIAKKLHEWMLAQRELVPEGSATAKALDYSLKRWVAMMRYLEMVLCPSTITRSKTRSGHGRSGAPIGCSPDLCAVANERQRS